jgi:hypothetical protein
MRIRFVDAGDEPALARRARLDERILALWQEIEKAAESGSSSEVERVARRELGALDAELACEVSAPDEHAPMRLVLSARGNPRLRPLVAAILAKAPERSRLMPVGERSALDQTAALARARAASGLELGGTRVRAGFTRGHLLSIAIHDPAFSGVPAGKARRAAELVCEGLLGERLLDDWVESVDAVPLAGSGPLRVLNTAADTALLEPLAELLPKVRAGIDGLLAGLPDRPCHVRQQADWTMFETQPELSDDWAEQDDLVMATTSMPEMLKSFLQGAPFHSGRFSRHGERFCYLKIDALGLDGRARLEQRSALEDALDRALVPEGHGCVIGNGFGVRYSYVNLALSDLDGALAAVRRIARELRAPERSWLLFFDAELAEEWVGVWPRALPPLGFPEP